MRLSVLKEINQKLLPELKEKYNLQDWDIVVQYHKFDDDATFFAFVDINEPYKAAVIVWNTGKLRHIKDENDVLEVLEHEFQHIALHPFEALRSIVLSTVDKKVHKIIDGEFDRTSERLRKVIGNLTGRGNRII